MRTHSSTLATSRLRQALTLPAIVLALAVYGSTAPWIPVLTAQAGDAKRPQADEGKRFDVVSVRRNTSGEQGGTNQGGPGRYTATNISLRMLIRNAYRVLDTQIISGPKLATADYMSAEKFDIVATFTGDATPEQRSAMMRNMLVDRFNLVARREMREMPVFALVKARRDGSLGPQLKSAIDPECSSPAAQQEREASRSGVPPAPATGAGGRGAARGPNCGGLQFGPGRYIARSVPISQLLTPLANQAAITGIDRVIIDRTGLTGRFDFELSWRMPVPPPGALPPGVTPPAVDPDQPDLFVALQEQLGLKLEPARAPIEVLIIDSVEMPSEN